jgi:hypothetical protein
VVATGWGLRMYRKDELAEHRGILGSETTLCNTTCPNS